MIDLGHFFSRLATPSRPRGGGASTSQGHPRTVFRRKLERGNLLVAEATARELPRVGLAEALELTLLIARKEPRRHPRAAAGAPWLSLRDQEGDATRGAGPEPTFGFGDPPLSEGAWEAPGY